MNGFGWLVGIMESRTVLSGNYVGIRITHGGQISGYRSSRERQMESPSPVI